MIKKRKEIYRLRMVSNPPTGTPPVARAGNDRTINLPTNSTTLDGSASTDSNGTITAYLWERISGTGGTITNPNSVTTTVTGLQETVYTFRLTVTDNDSLTDTDTVQVTVQNPYTGVLQVDDCSDTSGQNTLVDFTTPNVGGIVTLQGTSTPFNGGGNSYLFTFAGANQFYNDLSSLGISDFIAVINSSGVITSHTVCQ